MKLINSALTALILLASLHSYAAPASLSPKDRASAEQYQTVSMNSGVAERDKLRGVTYLDATQREQDRVIVENGIVYTSQGEVFPDTINSTPRHLDHINYVMDDNGNFYLFNEYATPQIRHSSIFDGGPVAGAGEIIIKGGRVTYIDSDSGHYRTQPLMPNVLSELGADGVDANSLGE